MWDDSSKFSLIRALVALVQMLVSPAVCVVTLLVSMQVMGVPFEQEYLALATISALLCLLFVRPVVTRQRTRFDSVTGIAAHVWLGWGAVIMVLLVLGYATKVSAVYSRRTLFLWFVLTPVGVTLAVVLLRRWAQQVLADASHARSAVIAGGNWVSQQFAMTLREYPELGFSLVGMFDDREASRCGAVLRDIWKGRFAELADFVREQHVDVVFIALPVAHLQRHGDWLADIQDTTASLYFMPDIFVFDLIQSQVMDINGIPVIALRESPFLGRRWLIKRLTDLVLASIMVVVLSPVLLAAALAVKLSSPGSVIFRQRRYGLDGEEIIVYKFRSMRVSEDGAKVVQATKDDPRVTPVGHILRKTSLDELPQLFNVIQGRMSLVGPRPHAVAHNEEYRRRIKGYMGRHKVMPGITGLAQVSGCRGETATLEDMERRVKYDLDYLRNWSLGLDLKILLKTLRVVLGDDRAY